MNFAQNRQNWVLSTKSVNKSVFDNKKGMEKPPSGLDGFPFTKGEIHNVRLLRYVGIFFIVGKFSPFYSGEVFPFWGLQKLRFCGVGFSGFVLCPC